MTATKPDDLSLNTLGGSRELTLSTNYPFTSTCVYPPTMATYINKSLKLLFLKVLFLKIGIIYVCVCS